MRRRGRGRVRTTGPSSRRCGSLANSLLVLDVSARRLAIGVGAVVPFDALDVALASQEREVREHLSDREALLKVQERIGKDLVGDLVRGVRLSSDDLQDGAQSPVVVPLDDSGALGPIPE